MLGPDASQLDLMNNSKISKKPDVFQNTSFEEDITAGIQDAREENKDDYFRKSDGVLTYLQFRMNDGKILYGNFSLNETTVLEVKEKLFRDEIENGKAVRLLIMGKMLKDDDLLSNYNLTNMSIIQALISKQLVRPDGVKASDGMIQTTDDKIGFDKFLRMRNKQYTDLQVHQMRLMFHSIMMRSGSEKTDETADGLLNNEEKWLNNELEPSESLLNLLNKKTVLSCRNDVVLPVNRTENHPIDNPNTKRDIFGWILFALIGLFLPFLSMLVFVFLIQAGPSKMKGLMWGNIIS